MYWLIVYCAIDKEAVAPGEGAFKTCIWLFSLMILKSINNSPFGLMACALTPAVPPFSNIYSSTSGIIFLAFATNAFDDKELANSPIANVKFLVIKFKKPL